MTPPRTSPSDDIIKDERGLEKLKTAFDAYEAGMHFIGSCGDGGCLIERPKGQHTNGGCRCSHDKSRAQRAMQRGRMLADAVRAALDGAKS